MKSILCRMSCVNDSRSRPARGGWVEIFYKRALSPPIVMSRPARGGWVEIHSPAATYDGGAVPPRTGRVG